MSPVGSQRTADGLPGYPLDARPSPVIPASALRAPECADGWPPQRVSGTPRCCQCSGPALAPLQACSRSQSRPVPGPAAAFGCCSNQARRSALQHIFPARTDISVQQPSALQTSLHTGQGHSTAAPAAALPPSPSNHILPTMSWNATQAQAVTLLFMPSSSGGSKRRL